MQSRGVKYGRFLFWPIRSWYTNGDHALSYWITMAAKIDVRLSEHYRRGLQNEDLLLLLFPVMIFYYNY